MESLRKDYNIVAAIDFGTTNCGVIYSFKKDYEQGIVRMWNNEGLNVSSYVKETSAILLDINQQFVAFGDDAETKYGMKAMDEEEKDKFFLFRYFKMHLHIEGKELTRYGDISDVNGKKKVKAKKIFSLSIHHLKKQLIGKLNDRADLNVKETEIRWVITIPAIWSEKATQLMREAGNDAGIPDDQLLLVYEPEAAAVLCKMETMERNDTNELETFNPGSKFMVVDLGGGTVDICVEEVNDKGNLKALDVTSGGASGGVKVDDAFLKFFVEIVGPDVFKKFKEEHPLDLYSLLKGFEEIKRNIKKENEEYFLQMPASIKDLIQMKLTTLEALISKSKHSSACKHQKGFLSLKVGLLKSFYIDTVDEIAKHIERCFENTRVKRIQVGTMIFVGGFSSSFFVRELLKDKFRHRVSRITVPNGAPMAILKGAIIFGHNPKAITERICPYTYGLKTRVIYDPKRHSKRNPITDKDGKQKINIFQKHVEKGEVIAVGEPLKNFKFVTVDASKKDVYWEVWRSEEEDPIFCDTETCTEIGRLEMTLEGKLDGTKRELSVQMTCRGTELEASAKDETTKSMIKQLRFNFFA